MKKLLLFMAIVFFAKINAQAPTIQNVLATPISFNNATIVYKITSSIGATTSIIKYGLSTSSLTNQVAGGSTVNVSTVLNTNLTGLAEQTTYYYQIETTNTSGTTISAIYNFTTTSPIIVSEYRFDSSLSNQQGLMPFSTSLSSYVADRNGVAGKAATLQGATATITALPIGSAQRSVSIWVKMPTFGSSGDYEIFNYGVATINKAYGVSMRNTGPVHFGYSNDLAFGGSLYGSNWVHVVTTFDGTDAYLYINGSVWNYGNKSVWNTTNSVFRLGMSVAGITTGTVTVDDLKIYNRALTGSEVNQLYTNNTVLSSQNFNTETKLQFSIYPNPATDILNIDIENEIKSLEIYSLLGQKVMSANAKSVKVSNLSKGIYMVRIEDENGAVATQKLVKE